MQEYNIYNFSKETITFLQDWLNAETDSLIELTANVRTEIDHFMQEESPMKTLTIYRADVSSDTFVETESIELKALSLWTLDKQMAVNWAEVEIGNPNGVIEAKVERKNIFLNTTLFNDDFIKYVIGEAPEEKRVIVNPGTYFFTEIM
jgi:hypothetical protein